MKQNSADNIVRGKFAESILKKIKGRCSGSIYEKIYDEKPSRKLFVGNLSPKKDLTAVSNIYSKTSPSSAGLEVLIKKDDLENAKIRIKAGALFYYKIFPTLEEQAEIYNLQKAGKYCCDTSSEDTQYDGEVSDASVNGYNLRTIYKKAQPSPITIELTLNELINDKMPSTGYFKDGSNLAKSAMSIFAEDKNKYKSHQYHSKNKKDREKELIVPEEALTSEEAFNSYLESWGTNPVEPKWNTGISYMLSNFNEDCLKLKITIDNLCQESRELKDVDNSLFETALEIEALNFNFQDYILDYLKDEYRYDGNIDASGFNCTTIKKGKSIIAIEHMPVFIQQKYKSKNPVSPDFKKLAEGPIEILNNISNCMEEEAKRLEAEFSLRNDLSEDGKRKFRDEIEGFNSEKRRFNRGIEVLRDNENALEAFKLMNESFANSGKNYHSWRLFQIVFIVIEIADILASSGLETSDTLDDVDLIYFPTGGGKTEAYLGLVVFTAFFDRLRGKKDGVTAITRFPLKLLSLQQLQRIADIFAQAELLRRKHPLIGNQGYAPFSTGYYVGEGNTPNKVYVASSQFGPGEDNISPINEDTDLQEKYKIISKCPFCGQNTVELIGNLEKLRIIHKCSNPECGEEVPVYISDQEVFRYLPTFIISTLDKMASAGWNKEFKSIFGDVKGKCPRHGYFSGKECLYRNKYTQDPNMCNVEKYQPADLFDPAPTLIIQDEIHLIRESLGTYDSHYESFLDHYIRSISGGKKIKIIGSSATVTDYEVQIRELYLKKGHKFPSSDSFYAYEDCNEKSRLIAGIMPHNKTVIFAVLDAIQIYHEEIEKLKQNPELALEMDVGFSSKPEVLETLKDYELELCYNIVKLEGDAVSQSIKTMVNPYLKSRDMREIETSRMTGDVTFKDVKEILSIVENRDQDKQLDLIVATSMISHGVDIDTMNYMVFRGMPRNTAEYIQALSRVGRRYPGIVLVIFNPARERDQSYYKYFTKYHEYKDLLVEPVPLSRWAKFSIERTLPGIFSACAINYLKDSNGLSPYMTNSFNTAYSSRIISDEMIQEFIQKCYKTDESEMGPYFEQFINEKIMEYINQIRLSDTNKFLPMILSEQPMTSLRDTDIPIEISPERESFEPMNRINAQISRSVD